MSDQTSIPGSESQSQRWLKYGSNTAVVCVVVVLLGVLVVYLAQRKDREYDTTAAGMYSLKPQTLRLIEANQQPITITSFYSKAKPGEATYGTGNDAATADAAGTADRQADIVADLLDEYASRGHDITVETIDPKLNPSKADALIEQVTDQYGGEVKKYRAFTDTLNGKYDAIAKAADVQLEQIKKLPLDTIQTQELIDTVNLAVVSVQDIPKQLKRTEDTYQKYLRQKPPDYKGITDTVSDNMTTLSGILGKVIDSFRTTKDDKAAPAAIRQYMASSAPAYQDMKKQADALVAEVKGLGELKLDTIREALHQDNAILVRGKNDWKVIRYDQVWKNDARDLRGAAAGVTPKPRFAGEQMITTAILALEQPTKTKVCFVRAGGQPIAESGGQFSSVAARLRDYNFDVSDKDLTGQWQMQAMQQQMPSTPEPSDADIDDAVWVVLDAMQQQQNPMMGGPPPGIAAKVAEHVTKGHHWANGKRLDGGSVYVLVYPRGESLDEPLQPFGIKLRTDAIAMHKPVPNEGAADTGDILDQAGRVPYIFPVKEWGRSEITDPINGLGGVLVAAVPVQATGQAEPLIPVPTEPDAPLSWGETDLTDLQNGTPTFNKATDIAGPLFAAAMGESANGSRAIAMGSAQTFEGSDLSYRSSIVDLPDPQLAQRGVYAPEFPGSAEFFMNGIFWLTHQEPMIAISPSALSVSRIAPMGHVAQGFWHVGVLLIGLPGLVLAAGVAAYVSRRD